nr:MAG TPA: hypothetical protein [Caudoviricetes sp.]
MNCFNMSCRLARLHIPLYVVLGYLSIANAKVQRIFGITK